MGGCTSKTTTAVISVPHDVQVRRMIRQNSSKADLQRQLDAYHSRPRMTPPNMEKVRPAPITIERPASFDESKLVHANTTPNVDSPNTEVSLASAVHSCNSSLSTVDLD